MKKNLSNNLFDLFILIPIKIIRLIERVTFPQIYIPSIYHLFKPGLIIMWFYGSITNIRESIVYILTQTFPFILSNIAWLWFIISLIVLPLIGSPILIFIFLTLWLFFLFKPYLNELIYMDIIDDLFLPILGAVIADLSFPGFNSFGFTPYYDMPSNWIVIHLTA